MLNTLLQAPDWLTASALVIAGILPALIANKLIVHTLRNTLGVRHPKTRSLLTHRTVTAFAGAGSRCRTEVTPFGRNPFMLHWVG